MLDLFQQQVVSALQTRSLLVRSCAGSGKSTTLAARALSLLGHGVAPERMLLLTFSVKSQQDLEAKVAQCLANAAKPSTGPQPQAPRVMTHHAHALSIVRAAGISYRVIEASAQRKLIRKLIHKRQPNTENMREALKQVLSLIAKAKGCGQPPRLGSAARAIYDEYEASLRASHLMDFEDMILIAASSARQLAATSPLRFDQLLLDEAQDMSDSQLELLQILAPPGAVTVTAVGDADQTIYSFRGSRPDVLSRIASWWRCETVPLPTNYRCASKVVDAARALIEGSSLRDVSLPLFAATGGGRVSVHAHATRDTEYAKLVEELRALQRPSSWPAGGVAVLCRTRARVSDVVAVLRGAGLRVVTQNQSVGGGGGRSDSGSAVRERLQSSAIELLSYLRLCVEPCDDGAFETAISMPPRTGFTVPMGMGTGSGSSSTAGLSAGFAYLHAVRAHLTASARTNNDRSAPKPVGLLAAAQAARDRGFPTVASAPGAATPCSLTRPQQTALRDFLTLAEQCRVHALSGRVLHHALVINLADKVDLHAHLEKIQKSQRTERRAFSIRVPGAAGGGGGFAASDDDDDDMDETDDQGYDAHGHAQSSVVSKAIHQLFQTAGHVQSRLDRESCMFRDRGNSDRLQALGRFLDAMAMASHDEDGGGGTSSNGQQRDVAEEAQPTQPIATGGAILVTTLHQAKGLEYDAVFLPGMVEGSLPLLPRGMMPNSLEYVEHIEEERRLCYVGFTRARRHLTLSWAAQEPERGSNGASSGSGFIDRKPSRFLPAAAPTADAAA